MEVKQVIILRNDLKMSFGKSVAQACHASLESYKRASKKIIAFWEISGMKKVVLGADKNSLLEIHKKVKAEKIPNYIVKDAGLTELKPGTITALGIGPELSEKIDKFTKELKLL